jgi:hypothetical protein
MVDRIVGDTLPPPNHSAAGMRMCLSAIEVLILNPFRWERVIVRYCKRIAASPAVSLADEKPSGDETTQGRRGAEGTTTSTNPVSVS